MTTAIAFFVSVWLKFFFLFTPFFALSMFLSMTPGYTDAARRRLALQVTGAVGVVCMALFFCRINILSKVTGLMLAALAAQMILTGVQHFLGPAGR